jgi:hypothetical protein
MFLEQNCRAARHPLACSKYNNIKSKDVGVVITHSEANPFKKFSCLISLIFSKFLERVTVFLFLCVVQIHLREAVQMTQVFRLFLHHPEAPAHQQRCSSQRCSSMIMETGFKVATLIKPELSACPHMHTRWALLTSFLMCVCVCVCVCVCKYWLWSMHVLNTHVFLQEFFWEFCL